MRRKKSFLKRLDIFIISSLKNIWIFLKDIDNIIFNGAKCPAKLRRTDNKFFDLCIYLWFKAARMLEKIDTFLWYRDKPYCSKTGRVRSLGELKISNWFYDNRIKAVFEKEIILKNEKGKEIAFHPDWYLPKYKIYLEYWGMYGYSLDYERNMQRKLAIYRFNDTPVGSIFPVDIKNNSNINTLIPEIIRETIKANKSKKRRWRPWWTRK